MRKNGISGCFSLFGFLALLLSGFTCFAILFSGVSAEAPQPLPEEARSVLPEPPETGPADTAVPGTGEVSGVSEAEETPETLPGMQTSRRPTPVQRKPIPFPLRPETKTCRRVRTR